MKRTTVKTDERESDRQLW